MSRKDDSLRSSASIASYRLLEAVRDRRVQLFAAGIGLALFIVVAAAAIATGDLKMAILMTAVVAAPFLMLLALTRPFVFPYCLYVALVPFDNLLSLGSFGTVTKLLGIASGVAVLIWIFRRRRLMRPPVTVPIACAYFAWMLVSSLWSVDVAHAIGDAQLMLSFLLIYVVLAVAPIEERDLRTICLWIVLGGVAAALYGIYYFHQTPPVEAQGRLFVVIGERNIDSNKFADSLLAPFALALVALLRARTIHAALAGVAAVAIIGEGIIISLSREAMLGCIGIALVIVLMSRRRLLALAVAVPVFAAIPLFVPSVARRLTDAVSSGGAGRTAIWQVDLHAWSLHPIFGWGEGSAMQAYSDNLLAVAPRLFAGWDRPAHNVPLSVLLDLGMVGFVLLSAAYFMTFRQLAGIRRGDSLYDLRVALTAALIGVGIASFFIDSSADKYLWVVLCTIAQVRIVKYLRAEADERAAIVYEPPPAPAQPARHFAR